MPDPAYILTEELADQLNGIATNTGDSQSKATILLAADRLNELHNALFSILRNLDHVMADEDLAAAIPNEEHRRQLIAAYQAAGSATHHPVD